VRRLDAAFPSGWQRTALLDSPGFELAAGAKLRAPPSIPDRPYWLTSVGSMD
jgi:hypothetical protein